MILLYRRRWGLIYLPVLTAAALAIWLLSQTWLQLPPRSLPLAVGVSGGGYDQAGERYRNELERLGISVELLVTDTGALGPLQRLANTSDTAEAGFAHGLLAERGPEAPVHALAVVGRQPLWVFTHHSGIVNLAMLRGLKVSAGQVGSATRQVAEQLFAQSLVQAKELSWVTSQGMGAANQLLEQQIDAMITIGSSDAPSVRMLTRSPGIHMVGIERANALATREPKLSPFVLPQGAIELRGNVPPRDLTLLSTGTHLLVRESMHPALQRALLDAATEIHATPTFLQQQSEFPDYQTDFPLSPVARAYALGERPWLEAVLPYWWAQLAALFLYGVLPVLALAGLMLLWIPRLFSLRVNAALAHHYGDLKFLEQELDQVSDNPIHLKQLLQRLDQMEAAVAGLDLPDRYADRWYTLREHLGAARERLLKVRGR